MSHLSRRSGRFFVLLLSLCTFWSALAGGSTPLDSSTAKQEVQSHGVGNTVRLTRKDGTEVRGRIVSIEDDGCVLQVNKQLVRVTVLFDEMTTVRGPGISHGAKIGIIVGVVLVGLGIAGSRV